MRFLQRTKRQAGFAGLGQRIERNRDDPRGLASIYSDLEYNYDCVKTHSYNDTIVFEGYDLFTCEEDAKRYSVCHGYNPHTFFIDDRR